MTAISKTSHPCRCRRNKKPRVNAEIVEWLRNFVATLYTDMDSSWVCPDDYWRPTELIFAGGPALHRRALSPHIGRKYAPAERVAAGEIVVTGGAKSAFLHADRPRSPQVDRPFVLTLPSAREVAEACEAPAAQAFTDEFIDEYYRQEELKRKKNGVPH